MLLAVPLGTKMPNDRNVAHCHVICWKMINGKWSPCWTTIEEVSKALGELKHCKCIKGAHRQDVEAREMICHAQSFVVVLENVI